MNGWMNRGRIVKKGSKSMSENESWKLSFIFYVYGMISGDDSLQEGERGGK